MSDTTTFFTRIFCFFWVFWAYVLRLLYSKHRSTTHSEDLEAGIPSDPVNRPIPNAKSNTACPVVSRSCSIDRFIDINLNLDSKIKEAKDSITTHTCPMQPSVIDTKHSRHFQPPAFNLEKNDKTVPVSLPAISMDTQIHVVDNRSKHRGFQFSPSAVPKLPEDRSKPKSKTKTKTRRHPDSISDLLDQFPTPPVHIPVRLPLINRDIVQQVVEKPSLAPAENCPSPTISEESAVSSNFGSNSILSTNPSISTSNDTANTSVPDVPKRVPYSSAGSKLSSGIDVKDKNIAGHTLVHNPETFVFPAKNVCGRARSQSLFTFKSKALPETYHDVVDSPNKADLQKGDISKDMLSKERKKVDIHAFILEDPASRDARADLQPLHVECSLVPIHNFENSSHRLLDKHAPVRMPVQVISAVPTTKSTRPIVAPLRIVKKNKIQPIVVPLALPVARRPESGNWEQAMENVLQAFRDAEMEDEDFRDLFYGDSSFVSQSSVIDASGDDRGNMDGRGEYDGDCEKRVEASFDSIENSVDENLSMLITPPDLVTLKVEDLASVSLSSEGAVAGRIMGVKVNNKLDLPSLRLCDCEGYEDSYSWTAATDDDDDDDDYHSQEDDQWSDRLELDAYAS